ncbi:MAG: Hpt domain-containing protein, partial [Halieaceae bacterium]
GLSRLANNEKLYVQLLGDLLAEYVDAASGMRALAAAGDSDQLRGAAHKIRGIANNLGATDIGASAEAIEKAALAGEAISDDQLETLAGALVVAADSHAIIMSQRQAIAASGSAGIDSLAVFNELQAAVAGFDPGATELIDQLLAAQKDDGELMARLTEARELLDNFNFADAEPLLEEIGRGLQA